MSSKLAISLIIGASVGGAIAGIRSLQNDLTILNNRSLSVSNRVAALGKNALKSVASLASLGTAVTSSVMVMSQPAIEFESAMADVKKVVEFDTPEQFKEMQQDILKLTRSIPMASDEIAAIVAAGGQSGIARENLLGFAEDAAKMGVAFDMAAGDAGTAMATMANVLGKPISDMAKFGDAINHLSDNANSKAADIVNVITRAGSDMKLLELTENQAAALGSTFLSMGKAPELAAQAMKGVSAAFQQLKAGDKSKELAKIGLTTKQFAQAMNNDAQGAILDFIKRIEKLPKNMQYAFAEDIFGKQYADDILLLMQNTQEYERQLNLLQETDENGNLKYIGSMQREFENRSATTENNLKLLKSSFSEVAIAIGQNLLPVINQVVESVKPFIYQMSDWIGANTETVKTILKIAGGVVTVIAGLLMLKTAFSLTLAAFLPFWTIGTKVFVYLQKIIRFNLPLIMQLSSILAGKLVFAIKSVTQSVLFLGRALLTTPIGLFITAIAIAAYAVYRYWEPIKSFFIQLWANVKQAFNSFCQFVSNIWNGIVGIWSAVWNGVSHYFLNIWESIKSLFNGNFSALGDIILAFNPLALLTSVFSSVMSYFGIDMPKSFTDFGKNIIDGLVNGITQAWDTAKEKVAELGEGIKNWFKEKLGIHSPSRVFMEYGKNTVQGLAIGITKNSPIATSAIDGMGDDIQKNIPLTSTLQAQTNASINGGLNIHFNPTINVNGHQGVDGVLNEVKEGLNMSLREFESLLNRVLDQRARRAY